MLGLILVITLCLCHAAGFADKHIEEIFKNKEDGDKKRKG